jgi:hypothetical protein
VHDGGLLASVAINCPTDQRADTPERETKASDPIDKPGNSAHFKFRYAEDDAHPRQHRYEEPESKGPPKKTDDYGLFHCAPPSDLSVGAPLSFTSSTAYLRTNRAVYGCERETRTVSRVVSQVDK